MSHVGVQDEPLAKEPVQFPTSPLAMGADASHTNSIVASTVVDRSATTANIARKIPPRRP